MNVISHGKCKESVTCGGQKREFTWQVQGIGHIVKFVAGAVFRGRCQNVGRRVSFEGLRFTWQVQGIRTMDPIFRHHSRKCPHFFYRAVEVFWSI